MRNPTRPSEVPASGRKEGKNEKKVSRCANYTTRRHDSWEMKIIINSPEFLSFPIPLSDPEVARGMNLQSRFRNRSPLEQEKNFPFQFLPDFAFRVKEDPRANSRENKCATSSSFDRISNSWRQFHRLYAYARVLRILALPRIAGDFFLSQRNRIWSVKGDSDGSEAPCVQARMPGKSKTRICVESASIRGNGWAFQQNEVYYGALR